MQTLRVRCVVLSGAHPGIDGGLSEFDGGSPAFDVRVAIPLEQLVVPIAGEGLCQLGKAGVAILGRRALPY